MLFMVSNLYALFKLFLQPGPPFLYPTPYSALTLTSDSPGVSTVVDTCNPNTQEAEGGKLGKVKAKLDKKDPI